ncbi:MAG: type III-D CRISPR-associated protein Csx19 [Ktedonobacteraceae bacterium]
MIQDICLAGTVSSIDALIQTYRIPGTLPVLMLLEQQPQQVSKPEERQKLLHFANFERTHNWSYYTSGRIFHQEGELRWEKQENGFQIAYTGHAQYSPELKNITSLELAHCSVNKRHYYLFGKRLDNEQVQDIGEPVQIGDFAEVRIPRLLRYPAPAKAERVQLVVKEYSDPSTRATIAFRFTELVGAK